MIAPSARTPVMSSAMGFRVKATASSSSAVVMPMIFLMPYAAIAPGRKIGPR